MRRTQQRLAIWMNGIRVGFWEKARGEDSLQYLLEWIVDEQGRPLSLSSSFTPGDQLRHGNVVRDYFDNLLPDSEGIHRRLATRYQSESLESFDLLAELGEDCVGTMQLLDVDEESTDLFPINYRPLSEADIATTLRNAMAASLPGRQDETDDLRLSIAGTQKKAALLWHEEQWCLPGGNTPTTHIFKLPPGLVGNMQVDMSASVGNEWLCSLLFEYYGIPVAETQIAQFEDQKALVVECFDRRWSDDRQWIIRLPQEDMRQALGVSSLRKYQSDGGPGISDIVDILSHSDQTEQDKEQFFRAQIIFWLLVATDGHAKNFNIAIEPQSHYHLTSLYDVLSTWPVIDHGNNQISWQRCKLAMTVRGSSNYYRIYRTQRRRRINHGELTELGRRRVKSIMDDTISSTPEVIERASMLLPESFLLELAECVFEGMRQQCRRLIGRE